MSACFPSPGASSSRHKFFINITNLDSLLRLIFSSLRDLFDVDQGMLSLVNQEKGTIEGRMAFDFPDTIVSDTVRRLYQEPHPDEDILAMVVRTGEPLITRGDLHPHAHRPTPAAVRIVLPLARTETDFGCQRFLMHGGAARDLAGCRVCSRRFITLPPPRLVTPPPSVDEAPRSMLS